MDRTNSKPYDQAFKFLAEQDAEALLLLLGLIQTGQQVQINLLPREISVSARLPDQPYEVIMGGERFLVHVEAQTAYDPNLPGRMLEYGVRLWLKYRLPIRSYVLLLTDRKLPETLPTGITESGGSLRLTLDYVPVCLWRLSARTALDLNRESLLPFVPLMEGNIDDIRSVASRLAKVPEESYRQELGLHFLLLGCLRYNREELIGLIGSESMIPIEQLKESSFYQHILEEGREEGRETGRQEGREEGRQEGREEGRQEGRQEGQHQALATVLTRQLESKFGALPGWALARIKSAGATTLEQWAISVLGATTLEDVLGPDRNP